MVDGYKGYNKVPEAQRCCCWAHIRRYWLRAIPKGHEKDYTHPAVQGFLYCNKLFEYERSYREKGLSLKQIYNRRLKDQKPVIEAFLSWLDQLHPESGDRLIKAINYSNGCRPFMMNYLKDGACSLSNNLSENSIRPLVVGRKNWLFCDTPAGADARIKQLEPVDDANHIIMDYSIHDAIEAGFNHVVFIIRKDIEKEFKEVIGDRIASICSSHNVTVDYAFQDINDIPEELPEGRTKPWGTGQAVLAAKDVIKTPFIVINADDYYGKEGFKAVHEYLVNGGKSCMAGFVLKNTLSDNGGVTRGICKMDENGNLTEAVETKNIVKTAAGAEADGVAADVNSLVSMNMWGLTQEFLDVLENGFKEFFEKEVPNNPQKAEYLIPTFIGELLEQGKMSVKVLKTNDTWYGMTYHEDVAAVKDSFKKMLEKGMYQADLFADL